MNILHIANITNSLYNGVCVAVPAHVFHQSKYANTALLNLNNCHIESNITQFNYSGNNWQDDVSKEFKSPDIVIFHGIYQFQYVKISRSLQKHNIPYIIIPHGELVQGAQNKKKIKKIIANHLFFNRYILGALAIQCLSENEQANTSFNVRKFISGNGIEISKQRKKNFHQDTVVINYIGRLEWYVKGLDLLIEAASKTSKILKEQNIQINIYGPDVKGRLYEVKKIIKQNNASELIIIHSAVTGKEKTDILRNSDIFIQTSRHEGLPMGILEALSLGIPCIITKGTSLGDFVKQNDAGWVADNNADSIAEILIKALHERNLWPIKSINAVNGIQECYSWDKLAYNSVNMYRNYIEGDYIPNEG